MRVDPRPEIITETLIHNVVHAFYARVRADAALGPIFESKLNGRWDAHLATMVDFWASVTLRAGRYAGKPHVRHHGLGLAPEHFQQWLAMFEATVNELCRGEAAAALIDRAHRIADSLQISLNIGPKALHFPAFAGGGNARAAR
ncbi:group III truncated hemoglobin [Aureimonas fodinaquatilis]|uniref:Group III truncated hemoglobin n=1 Tax=Aureimonas fodinaquatilis TaxID=2565783 RepID=A0A5B0DR05_9HYPH|nr:group III truncated hemoglobin [Aureimonas fodinaquatilis]KAA0968863.1 group III truncated hemoglobin [Aureimonas fodinaquatilis]